MTEQQIAENEQAITDATALADAQALQRELRAMREQLAVVSGALQNLQRQIEVTAKKEDVHQVASQLAVLLLRAFADLDYRLTIHAIDSRRAAR